MRQITFHSKAWRPPYRRDHESSRRPEMRPTASAHVTAIPEICERQPVDPRKVVLRASRKNGSIPAISQHFADLTLARHASNMPADHTFRLVKCDSSTEHLPMA